MDVQTAVEIIASSTDARSAIERMNLPRCRLHALLTSRTFIQTMEDYRIVTQSLCTMRAGQYAGLMMINLANMTNGNNEDSSRKAAMAGLSQAMDGHIRPGPGRPPKTPSIPAPGATPSYSKVCPKGLTSQETHEPSGPTSPVAAHTLEQIGRALPDTAAAPVGLRRCRAVPDLLGLIAPLPDLRENILNFIHNAPPALTDPPAGPVSIDKDRQIPTEMHGMFVDNTLYDKDLHFPDPQEKLDPPACPAAAGTAT
jgi:hypothetical protein